MLVTRRTDLPKEAIFKVIKESLKADYESATGKVLSDDAIGSGLTYLKTFGQKGQNSVKITVETLQEPDCYAVLYSTNRGKQLLTYQLMTLSDGQTEVSCRQAVLTEGIVQKANQYLTNLFFRKSLEKRLDAQLQGLIYTTEQSVKD